MELRVSGHSGRWEERLNSRLVDTAEKDRHNQDQNPDPGAERQRAIWTRELSGEVANDVLVLPQSVFCLEEASIAHTSDLSSALLSEISAQISHPKDPRCNGS